MDRGTPRKNHPAARLASRAAIFWVSEAISLQKVAD